MTSHQEGGSPVYRQIAIDIARSIAAGKYGNGQKLFGRSVLASHYRVSPETIRKAVFLLKDVGILATEKGSGIEVVSSDKAREFIERYNEMESISSIHNEIVHSLQAQAEQTTKILQKVQYIVSAADRLNTVSPLNPYRIKVTADCKLLGKALGEVQFWHHTGGTVIAIQRKDEMIISPGPYAIFLEDDVFFIVGDSTSYSAIIKMLFT